MEHKGITYTVVQTANPTGWRWTVELPSPLKNRTGEALSRDWAVKKAMSIIDNLPVRVPNLQKDSPEQTTLGRYNEVDAAKRPALD